MNVQYLNLLYQTVAVFVEVDMLIYEFWRTQTTAVQ